MEKAREKRFLHYIFEPLYMCSKERTSAVRLCYY